jgi:hypothetical protein
MVNKQIPNIKHIEGLVMINFYFPWYTILKNFFKIVSRQTHMMVCYKAVLYEKLACCMVKHLLAIKINITLLFGSFILK